MMSSKSEPQSSTSATSVAEFLEQNVRQSSPSAAAGAAGPSVEAPFNPPNLQPGPGEKKAYLVKWNQFEDQLCNAFSELFCSDHFADVTLACDREFLKAHKVVLAMASPFFKRIFQETPCKHPVVIIKGMSPKTLRSILQYIYLGELVLNEGNVNDFMDAADYLSICGVHARLYRCDVSTVVFTKSESARESEQEEDSKHSEAAGLTSENEDIELQIDEERKGGATSVASPVIQYHGVKSKSRWSRRYSNTSYHGSPTRTSPVANEQKRSASAGELESVSQSSKPSDDTENSNSMASPVQTLVEAPSDVEANIGEDSETFEEQPPITTPDPEGRQTKVIKRAYPQQFGHTYRESKEAHTEDWKYQGPFPPVFAPPIASTSVTRTHQQSPYHIGAKDFSHPLQVNVESLAQTQHAPSSSSTTTCLDFHAPTKPKLSSDISLYHPSSSPLSMLSQQRPMHRAHSESDYPPSSSPISLVSSQRREDRVIRPRQQSGGSSTSHTYLPPEYASRTHISILSSQGLQLPRDHRPRPQYMGGVHREQLEGRFRQEERGRSGYGTSQDFLQQSPLRFGGIPGMPHSFPTDLSLPLPHQFSAGYVPQLKSPSSSSGGFGSSTTTRPKTKAIRSSQVPQSSRYTAAEVDSMVEAVAHHPGNVVPCTLCQKFVKRERLRAHIHECHLLTGEKIICPHCGIALKSKGSFRVHIWRHKRGALPTRSTMSDFDRDRPPSPNAGPATN